MVDEQRRDRCARSFRGFCETYFPAAFYLPWSEDHLRVIAKIERAVLEGGLFAFAMPRGSGKSSLARVAALWAVLYGYRAYVCIIGSAEDRAKMMLEAIKRDLLGNELLLEDFPEAIYSIRKLENNARKQIGQLCEGRPRAAAVQPDPADPQRIGSVSRRGVLSRGMSGQLRRTFGDSSVRSLPMKNEKPKFVDSSYCRARVNCGLCQSSSGVGVGMRRQWATKYEMPAMVTVNGVEVPKCPYGKEPDCPETDGKSIRAENETRRKEHE